MDINKLHNLHIILLCGIYGSGKTEFALKYFKGKDRFRISRSEIRKYMFEMTSFGEHWSAYSFNESHDALVKHIERKTVEHYFHSNQKIIIINTFVTAKSRKRFIELAKSQKKTIGAIFIKRPVDVCIKRNAASSEVVPENVIRTLSNKIELPEKKEGFDEVVILSQKE